MSLIHSIGIDPVILSWVYLAGGAVAVTTLILLSRMSPTHKNGIPLPPGPPAAWPWQYPMPKQNVVKRLAAFVEQYGPMVCFRCGSHVTIVIGHMDAATEIMEKEGGALVDRPRLISVGEIHSGGKSLVTSSGDMFRRLRRAANTHLQQKVAVQYHAIQTETAKDFILDILNDPKQHILHAERYAAAVMLRVTYGKTSPTSSDDPEVVRVQQVMTNLETAFRPGAYLVDRIPWLKYVPGYGRQLREFHRYEMSLFRDQLNRVRNDIAMSNAGPSIGRSLLEHINDYRLSDDEMTYLAGSFFGAGSDTTACGITVMIMAAACHPDAQARVQEELDNVVGRDRVPTFGDWDMLPQLHAFILEALRWIPLTPLGFAHLATKDIIWRGQCIPAGATVIGSHWVISRDPVAFPDPETFNPLRWLTEDGRVRMDMRFYTYGFGRRVCPGQHIAKRSLYMNAALLLWSFRVMQRPEAPINAHAAARPDVVVFHPEPFEVDFVPRVEEQWLRELMV